MYNRLRGKVSLFHLHKLKEKQLAATIIRKINKPSHVKSRTAFTFTHCFPSIFKSSFKVLPKKKPKTQKQKGANFDLAGFSNHHILSLSSPLTGL